MNRILILPVLLVLGAGLQAKEFSVMAYNVENLFDADGIAAYDDFHPEKYTPTHLAVKAQNLASVIARADGGRGPDVLILNEVEVDQTPDSTVPDLDEWLKSVRRRTIGQLLGQSPLPEELAGLPAEAWLVKALEDAGLRGYHVASSGEGPGKYEDGRPVAVRNVILSRLPIQAVRSHKTASARDILEVELDADGHPLHVFANHWKSGASDPAEEKIRIRNAETLRRRLDEIFKEDPSADVILAGDFNSHYNQNRRYRFMKPTALNDILGSQGNELALRGDGADLYNLWFELPSDRRGSDIYQREWGTLMNIIVSRGLYDQNGVQYIDNSFSVLKIPGLNADVFGRPIRWSRGRTPGGFSDHFPLVARFRTVDNGARDRWMPLSQPSRTATGPGTPLEVETSTVDLFASAPSPETLPEGADLRDGSFTGRVLRVDAPARIDPRGIVHVTVLGEEYDIFTHKRDLRPEIRDQVRKTGRLVFHGELALYRGRWEFILHGREWLEAPKP